MNDQQAREIARGEHARRILEDELVQEVLEHLKSTIRNAVFELPVEAKEQREALFLMDRAREQFVSVFAALIQGAEVSKYELLAEENVKAKLEAIKEKVRNG